MSRKNSGIAAILILATVLWLFFYPPRFWLNLTKGVSPSPAVGAQLVDQYACRGCHKIGNEGTLKGPNLAGITQRVTDPAQVTLRLWLKDPKAVKGDTAMPNYNLSDSEIEAVLLYLVELDNQSPAN